MKQLKKPLMMVAILASAGAWSACNPNMDRLKPDSIYAADAGNNTVTDAETGLTWMKCNRGKSGANCETGSSAFTWKAALETAQSARSANMYGFNDWRLPSITELRSLIDKSCYNPSLNTTVFPNSAETGFWSSSPDVNLEDNVLGIYLDDGDEFTMQKDWSRSVKLVRGGQ